MLRSVLFLTHKAALLYLNPEGCANKSTVYVQCLSPKHMFCVLEAWLIFFPIEYLLCFFACWFSVVRNRWQGGTCFLRCSRAPELKIWRPKLPHGASSGFSFFILLDFQSLSLCHKTLCLLPFCMLCRLQNLKLWELFLYRYFPVRVSTHEYELWKSHDGTCYNFFYHCSLHRADDPIRFRSN